MSDQPKRPKRTTKLSQQKMFLSGPGAGKTYLPAYPRLPRQFGGMLEQTAVEVLSALYPGLEVRKRIGETMVTAYFERPGFSKPTRWAVACLMTPDLESRTTEHWQRYEPLISSNEIDRVLFVTEHDVNLEARGLMQSLQGVEHVTVSRLQAMLADSKPKRGSRKRVPAAEGFVHLDHNRPNVDAAREALEEAAFAVETTNSPVVNPDEGKAIAAEIRTLAAMLNERMIRLVQVQLAASERGVLAYAKGKFKDHLAGAAVSRAFDLFVAAIKHFLG